MPARERELFVAGVYSGLVSSSLIGADEPTVKKIAKCSSEWSSKQLTVIVDREIERNPESWHRGANIQVIFALQKSCGFELPKKRNSDLNP